MTARATALQQTLSAFDAGDFENRLAALVAIPSSSQEAVHAPALTSYLETGIGPWLEALGFKWAIHPNPHPGAGPIMLAERFEGEALPTVITYGHGDTVGGMDAQWTNGRTPWALWRETHPTGERWYGRGTADNKGQHVINLFALEQVLAARGGRLGANVKLVLETGEERGSPGLDAFVAAHSQQLAADIFIASDGPRVTPTTPTLAMGTRGSYRFDLVVAPRKGGVHSGHWGGLTSDPAIVLAHALAAICDRQGRMLVEGWRPSPLPSEIRAMLADCPVDMGNEAARLEPGWGEPGLSPAEKLYAWNSFIVLAMLSGQPDSPTNAVAPWARACCQIRYVARTDPTTLMPALRAHLDTAGFPEVQIEAPRINMPASASAPNDPWVQWAAASMARSLGHDIQRIPGTSGGMPGNIFQDHLGTPLIWIPHGHNGCQQHGPDEHLLVEAAREGVHAFAGLWWDLGTHEASEGAPPCRRALFQR